MGGNCNQGVKEVIEKITDLLMMRKSNAIMREQQPSAEMDIQDKNNEITRGI